MKCHFVDSRLNFFSALAEKLGSDFEFTPHSPADLETRNDPDVILVGIPSSTDPLFQPRIALLNRITRTPGAPPVVATLPQSERHTPRLVFEAGAYDCFVETVSIEEIRIVLRRAAKFREMTAEIGLLRRKAPVSGFRNVIGSNPKMCAIYSFAARVASSDAAILVTGETGTGKDLLARTIHEASPRISQPFLAVSCSSLPEHLIEAELFGHERGAFTGAHNARQGRFEAAQKGTLFLDEVGELSPSLQVKLLRVLQEGVFERLGSNAPRRFNGRVICATNRNLRDMVKAGRFRADLYYRLNTIEILMPPLRERRDDILALAYHFLQQFALKYDRPAHRISTAAMTALQEYSWPGNVRELQHVIERAVVMSEGPDIEIDQLPEQFLEFSSSLGVTFENEVKDFKRRLIQRALAEYGNNKLQAARSLGIARSSLHRLIEELQIASPIEPSIH